MTDTLDLKPRPTMPDLALFGLVPVRGDRAAWTWAAVAAGHTDPFDRGRNAVCTAGSVYGVSDYLNQQFERLMDYWPSVHAVRIYLKREGGQRVQTTRAFMGLPVEGLTFRERSRYARLWLSDIARRPGLEGAELAIHTVKSPGRWDWSRCLTDDAKNHP